MKIGFSQAAEYKTSGAIDSVTLNSLQKAIRHHSGLAYFCIRTENGYFLKPDLRNMPYRNSFFPEIDIRISQNLGPTILYITGQPVLFARVFMQLWISCSLVTSIILLVTTISSRIDFVFSALVAFLLSVFGYYLGKIASKKPFDDVVKAIQEVFPPQI